MGGKMPASWWRAYRRRRRDEGRTVRRRAGYVRKDRLAPTLGRVRRVHYPTDVVIPRFDAHPLIAAAVEHLRSGERHEVTQGYDSWSGDLVGEYVLAALDGRDPLDAMEAYRARRREDALVLVYGTALVDGLER